jgi:hypothetical protein
LVFLCDVSDPHPVIEELKGVSSLGFFGHPPRILFVKSEGEVKLYHKVLGIIEPKIVLYESVLS